MGKERSEETPFFEVGDAAYRRGVRHSLREEADNSRINGKGKHMRIEEEHPDVLQNIEFAVASFYRRNPEMTDYPVLRIYEALVQYYSAETKGHTAKPMEPSGLEAELLSDVKFMCEWRLGRIERTTEEGVAIKYEPAIDIPTLVLCLKRLVKSVKTWNKHGGRRGYLDFMTQYVR